MIQRQTGEINPDRFYRLNGNNIETKQNGQWVLHSSHPTRDAARIKLRSLYRGRKSRKYPDLYSDIGGLGPKRLYDPSQGLY
jgi:hypothetical protein